jgi:hypothetical protein
MPIFITNEWQLGKKRPDWAGPVTIVIEEIPHRAFGLVSRQTSVMGIVAARSTKGRKSAPEPLSQFRVSTSAPTSSNPLAFHQRNTGRIDLDKGHIMALELGGPDIPENIVPQWSNFQRNGAWKRMENGVRKTAEEMDGSLYLVYFAMVRYKNYKDLTTASFTGLCVPSGFTVYTIEQDEKGSQGKKTLVFDDDQAQDETDDMVALRTMEKADRLDYTEMYDDLTKKGSGKKQKLAFGEKGQNPLYGPPPVTYSTQGKFTPTMTDLWLNTSVTSSMDMGE